MKRGRINWKYLAEQLLQSAVGIPAGGFRVDESGHPVEDYLEADEAGLLQALAAEAQRDPLDALAECQAPSGAAVNAALPADANSSSGRPEASSSPATPNGDGTAHRDGDAHPDDAASPDDAIRALDLLFDPEE